MHANASDTIDRIMAKVQNKVEHKIFRGFDVEHLLNMERSKLKNGQLYMCWATSPAFAGC